MFNPKYKLKSQKYYFCICQPNMLAKKKIDKPNPNTKKLCDSLSAGRLVSQPSSLQTQPG